MFICLVVIVIVGFTTPMPVQKAAIPRLLSGENLVLSAGTGSGKTLAYVLPVIQRLLEEESEGYVRVVGNIVLYRIELSCIVMFSFLHILF